MLDAVSLSEPAVRLSLVAAGIFFWVGLVSGVWKYAHIARSPQAVAPVYVDICHRTSLLYSFAALLVAQFAALSAWTATTDLIAAAIPLAFFAAAIGGYALHGFLRDTDNQFLQPQKIGSYTLPRGALRGFMWLLVLGEIGGFSVLLLGTLRTLGLL